MAEFGNVGEPTRACVQCKKICSKRQYEKREWKKTSDSSCRNCAAYSSKSIDLERKCSKCLLQLSRDHFNIHQWDKPNRLCVPCCVEFEASFAEKMQKIGLSDIETKADGILLCQDHQLERCDICMIDFTPMNWMHRERERLGRDLTQAESASFFDFGHINPKICILDGQPVCARSGMKLKCVCGQVTYCSKVCQSYHWPIHKMTCTAKSSKSKKTKDTLAPAAVPAGVPTTEESSLASKTQNQNDAVSTADFEASLVSAAVVASATTTKSAVATVDTEGGDDDDEDDGGPAAAKEGKKKKKNRGSKKKKKKKKTKGPPHSLLRLQEMIDRAADGSLIKLEAVIYSDTKDATATNTNTPLIISRPIIIEGCGTDEEEGYGTLLNFPIVVEMPTTTSTSIQLPFPRNSVLIIRKCRLLHGLIIKSNEFDDIQLLECHISLPNAKEKYEHQITTRGDCIEINGCKKLLISGCHVHGGSDGIGLNGSCRGVHIKDSEIKYACCRGIFASDHFIIEDSTVTNIGSYGMKTRMGATRKGTCHIQPGPWDF